jgi:LacI family transcriptional regulator
MPEPTAKSAVARSQSDPYRRKGRPTLREVARLSGLSPSTVSAILNNREYCWSSQASRDKVMDAAKALGYRPNLAARALRGGQTHTIGLITAALNVEVTSLKMEGFEQAAREAGFATMFAYNANDPAIEDRLINKFIDRDIDALVVFPSETGSHDELRRLVEQAKTPVLTIDGSGRVDLPCDDVSTDYYAAGRLQAQHLIELGCRQLCHLKTFPTCFSKDQLRTGFVDAATEAPGVEPVLLANPEENPNAGSVMTTELLRQLHDYFLAYRGRIDGIASYDLAACAAIHAAMSAGLRVPQDLKVVGFDDSPVAMNCVVPLSSVGQSAREQGRKAFEILSRRLNDSDSSIDGGHERVRVAPVLVRRASTGETPSL